MLAALLGAALALPPAFLGPDGPAWIGPLPPHEGADGLRGAPWTHAVVVVSPLDGALWVQEQDLPGQVRVYSGGEWTVDGARITDEWPPGDAVGYRLSEDGQLRGVSSVGGSQRLAYDEVGRLSSITWADGARMEVGYDALGRVVSVIGPGLSRWRLRWGSALRVQDALGHLTSFFWRDGPDGRILEVQDPLGRTARTFYSADPTPTLLGWEDPRGLRTHLTREGDLLTVSDGAGRQWRVTVDERRRPEVVETPSGKRWAWERDEGGLLVNRTDPSGRTVRWERSRQGHIVAVSTGGTPARFARDSEGRVTAITDPTGAVTVLSRDASGRISEITDATGNKLGIERYANGMPMAILSRTGGRWGLGLDLQGRPDRLIDPTDRVVAFHRDGLGWLSRLVDDRFGTLRLDRRSDGVLTRLTGTRGEKTGLIRDAAGRIAQIRLPDGEVMRLARDVLGELVRVSLGDAAVEIRRDAAGLPVAAGEVAWSREPDGAVRQITTPAMDLTLRRDPAGRLSGLSSGAWWLNIERDLTGRPIHWEGSDGLVVAVRDAAGRIAEEEGTVKTTLLRDPRGLLNRLSVEGMTWQWQRDAAGRPMRLVGPDSLALGLNRDPAGRVTLVRLPDGTLLKRKWAGAGVIEQLFSSAGRLLTEVLTDFDEAGRILRRQGTGVTDERWRYTPGGDLVAIETGTGAWARGADRILGADSSLTLLDSKGRMVEARLTDGAPAWGVGMTLLSVYWDDAGRLSEVTGEGGVLYPEYDDLGRLSGLRTVDGARWALRYDARGRLSHLTTPSGFTRMLLWAPEAFDGWWDGEGTAVPMADGLPRVSGAGAVLSSSQAWLDLLGGDRWWIGRDETDSPAAAALERTPVGRAKSLRDGLVGVDGALQPFPGGPLIFGTTAIEPVSGRRMDGLSPLPWAAQSLRDDPRSLALDPERWAPRSGWGRPLEVLEALGELAPVDGGDWMPGSPAPPALYWLPPSLEGGEAPLGPEPDALPMTADPITAALIRAVLPGGEPPTPSLVLEAILDEERERLDLPPDVPLSWFSE